MAAERNQFLRLLQAHFNLDELRDLCFQLENVAYEDLPGEARSAKMRSLLLYCERHGLTASLEASCKRLRPNVSWPSLQTEPATEILEVNLEQTSATITLGDRIDTITGSANDGDASQWRTIADKNRLKNPRKLQPGQALVPDTIVGSGWAFPLRISAQGGLVTTNEQNEIEESIATILMTAPGERLMHPTFGCRLNELCFMPNNKQTLTLTQTYVKEALQKWETRITVLEVQTSYRSFSPSCGIEITISYETKATREQNRSYFIFHLLYLFGTKNQNNIERWDGSPDLF